MALGSGPIVHGLSNCDTVKKSRAWLDSHGIAHAFHDFKKAGLEAPRLSAWMAALGAERLLNRRGTTWRKLDPTDQPATGDGEAAKALMLRQPSVIKRPVVEWPDGAVTVGFDEAEWAARIEQR